MCPCRRVLTSWHRRCEEDLYNRPTFLATTSFCMSSFLFDGELDFRYIPIRIAAEDRAGTFYVDLARWKRDFVAFFVDVFKQFRVGVFQVFVHAMVQKCDAVSGG